jgi:hypothetical protein
MENGKREWKLENGLGRPQTPKGRNLLQLSQHTSAHNGYFALSLRKPESKTIFSLDIYRPHIKI